jgi:hypothetical protein
MDIDVTSDERDLAGEPCPLCNGEANVEFRSIDTIFGVHDCCALCRTKYGLEREQDQ